MASRWKDKPLRTLLEGYVLRGHLFDVFEDFEDVSVKRMAEDRDRIEEGVELLREIGHRLPPGSIVSNDELLSFALLIGWATSAGAGERVLSATEPSQRDTRDLVDSLERVLTAAGQDLPFSVMLYDASWDYEEDDKWEVRVDEAGMPFRSVVLRSSVVPRDDEEAEMTLSVTLSGAVTVPAHSLGSKFGWWVGEDLVRTVVGASIALGLAKPPGHLRIPGGEPRYGRIPLRAGDLSRDMRPEVCSVVSATGFVTPDYESTGSVPRIGKPIPDAHERAWLARLLRDRPTTPLATAVRLFFDSFSVHDRGLSMALAFSAIETALLQKGQTESVMARLKEAVTYRLGVSPDSRETIRRLVDALYAERSNFTHAGGGSSHARAATIRLAAAVLRRELADASDNDQGTSGSG